MHLNTEAEYLKTHSVTYYKKFSQSQDFEFSEFLHLSDIYPDYKVAVYSFSVKCQSVKCFQNSEPTLTT